jgi:hypothetical protein
MHRLIPLLSIALLTSCATSKPPVLQSGPTMIQGFDAAGNPTSTSYVGRTAAGQGQVNDTASAEMIRALAAKIDGSNFTFAEATRSAVAQPDVAIDSEIETKHKAALADAGQALAAGASGNYAKAIAEAASLGGQLIAARTARANAPKPDSGAISTRILSSGEGHALAATVGIQTFGATIQASKRATYQSDSKASTVDDSTAADFEALAKTFAALKALQSPAVPPAAPVEAPIVFPPLPPVIPSTTNTTETITLPGLPQ